MAEVENKHLGSMEGLRRSMLREIRQKREAEQETPKPEQKPKKDLLTEIMENLNRID